MIYSTNETPNVIEVNPISGNGGGNGGAWGGDWASFIVLFLIFAIFGWGGYGFGGGMGGGGNMSGMLTRADLCQDMNFGQLENGVRGISNGIAESTFALNNAIGNVGTQVIQGTNTLSNAICNLGYTTQQGFNETNVSFMQGMNSLQALIQSCCCDTQRAIDGINYNMATNTCAIQTSLSNVARDIVDNANSNTRAILDFLTQDKISNLQSENAALRLSASQDRQNALLTSAMTAQTAQILGTLNPTPIPSYQVPNPNAVYYGGYYGNNCGGCGCGI